uniref:Uncharacterized protein n=1 Tax=Nelumbo nucifera TaxID=4432 RepID=A0A822XM64_NELNU|nr:TPA_asm: hypothetical protein HUJ06_020091 [Nelumbo nucifera]
MWYSCNFSKKKRGRGKGRINKRRERETCLNNLENKKHVSVNLPMYTLPML